MLRSNLGYIGIGVQSAKGTQQDTPEWFPKFYGGDKFQSDHTVEHLREAGDGELVGATVKTGYKEKFGFDIHARPEAIARVLAYVLGQDTVTGADDPYTHTIIRNATNERAWLSIHRKIDDAVVQILKDARISKITIKGDAGKPIEVSVEGDALSSSLTASESVPAYETLPVFVFYDGAGTFLLEDGVTRAIKSFQITISVGTEMLQTDDISFNDIPDLRLDIDLSLQFVVEDTDLFAKSVYNGGTTVGREVYTGSFEANLNYTDPDSVPRQMKLTIPKFEWKPVTGMNLNSEGKSMIVTLAGIAVKPDAGEILTAVIVNDVPTAIYHS